MARQGINFSKGYAELEQIVTDFESRDLDLEKDLPQFKRGMELAAKLKRRLQEIETTVVAIEQDYAAQTEGNGDEDDEE